MLQWDATKEIVAVGRMLRVECVCRGRAAATKHAPHLPSVHVYCKTGQYCRCGSMRNTCQDTPAPTFTNQQCKIVSEIFGVTVGSAAAPKPTAPSVDSII